MTRISETWAVTTARSDEKNIKPNVRWLRRYPHHYLRGRVSQRSHRLTFHHFDDVTAGRSRRWLTVEDGAQPRLHVGRGFLEVVPHGGEGWLKETT